MKKEELINKIYNNKELLVVGNIFTAEHFMEMFDISMDKALRFIKFCKDLNNNACGVDFANDDIEEFMNMYNENYENSK